MRRSLLHPLFVSFGTLGLIVGLAACRAPQRAIAPDGGQVASDGARAAVVRPRASNVRPVERVVCLYDQRPWLNLDRAGDRDPEGVHYRVFLVSRGGQRGAHHPGTFHVEMYKLDRGPEGELRRELVSDWHYASHEVPQIADPGMLGDGYHLHLRWSSKDLAGSEVEFITQFEQPDGRVVRSGTKRLRIPDYTS